MKWHWSSPFLKTWIGEKASVKTHKPIMEKKTYSKQIFNSTKELFFIVAEPVPWTQV
jgi:hypothetical protein